MLFVLTSAIFKDMNVIWSSGVSKLNFPVAKFKSLVAKSKCWLTEEKLPPIIYLCYWYFVLVIGSIPFLKVSTLNFFYYDANNT